MSNILPLLIFFSVRCCVVLIKQRIVEACRVKRMVEVETWCHTYKCRSINFKSIRPCDDRLYTHRFSTAREAYIDILI